MIPSRALRKTLLLVTEGGGIRYGRYAGKRIIPGRGGKYAVIRDCCSIHASGGVLKEGTYLLRQNTIKYWMKASLELGDAVDFKTIQGIIYEDAKRHLSAREAKRVLIRMQRRLEKVVQRHTGL